MSDPTRRTAGLAAAALLTLAGCQGQEPAAERYREKALQSAYEIGQVQMSCPDATPSMTSSQTVQKADPQGLALPQHEYTVAVAGCGASRTYLIVCREDGSGCAPAAP